VCLTREVGMCEVFGISLLAHSRLQKLASRLMGGEFRSGRTLAYFRAIGVESRSRCDVLADRGPLFPCSEVYSSSRIATPLIKASNTP
jgi:hypothetical protein